MLTSGKLRNCLVSLFRCAEARWVGGFLRLRCHIGY